MALSNGVAGISVDLSDAGSSAGHVRAAARPAERLPGGGLEVGRSPRGRSPGLPEAEDRPRLLPGRDGPLVLLAELGRPPDQRCVRRREGVAVEPHVVLEPGAGVAAGGDRPFVQHDLVPPDPRAAPFRVGGEPVQRLDVEVERLACRPASRSSRPSRTGRRAALSDARRPASSPPGRCGTGRRPRSRASRRVPASRRPASRPGRAGSRRPASGSCSTRPRARPCRASAAASRRAPVPAPERPPVESCTIIPGQCFSIPSFRRAKRSGSAVGFGLRRGHGNGRWWRPPRRPRGSISTCSATVIGTAGLSSLRGTDPVMATQMMQGLVM